MNEEELNEEESFEPDPSQGVAEPDFTLDKALLTKGKTLLGVGTSAIVRNIYTKISKIDGVQEMLTKAQEQLPSISQKGVEEFKTQAAGRIQEIMRKLSESSFDVDTLKRAVGKINEKTSGGGFGGGGLPSDDDDDDEEKELLRRYRELENPDSYIVDPADPNYGKLKSDILPNRQREAARKALLEGKGDLLLNALDQNELELIFPKSYRSFYRKLKPDKKGRFVDLKKSLDVATIREMYPGEENEDFRRTVFALAADPRFSSTVYQRTRKSLIAEWLEGLDDIQDRVIKETNNTKLLEAHHVRSIRHVAALFDGLDFQQRIILRNRLLNNMFPVGNNPDNLVLLNDDIHDEIHRQLDEKIGKTAKKFIDPKRKYTIEEKEEIAARMGTIINQLTEEAKDSMAEYMADKYTEVSPSARMAAEMDITEVTGVLDATLEGYLEFVNRRGFMSIQRRIDDMDYFPEDEPPPDLRLERLTRGRGKKQLELERKYGKQLDLFKDGQ